MESSDTYGIHKFDVHLYRYLYNNDCTFFPCKCTRTEIARLQLIYLIHADSDLPRA